MAAQEPNYGNKLFLSALLLCTLLALWWLFQGPLMEGRVQPTGATPGESETAGSPDQSGPSDTDPRDHAAPVTDSPEPFLPSQDLASSSPNDPVAGVSGSAGNGGGAEQESNWDGGWLTQNAMGEPAMTGRSPGNPDYDATIEARQLFHPFEMDLRATQPLKPLRYRELLGQHKKNNAAALRRVGELRRAGHPEAASELYEEWSRLFELYRRSTYSSAGKHSSRPSEAPR